MRLRWLLLSLVVVALLVPAVMITVARMLEPGGGRWVRLVSFTPYAVALYALAMLFLLVVVAAGRGFRRRAAGTVCVLILPLLALHLWWASGPYVGQPAASAKQGEVFTVMSSNLSFGDADPARVMSVALRNDADILVLTEITPTTLVRLRAAGLDQAFPFARGKAAPGVSGTMVFSTFRLSRAEPLDTTFGGYRMTVALPGQERVRLIAVHPYPPTGDARDWRADHAALRRAAVGAEAPTIIAGDLNATLDHAPLRELAGRGFADAAEQATSGWQPTWPAAGERRVLGVPVPSLLAIDHVLVTDELVATQTQSVTIEGTDHRALVARLALR
ncbi:MAG TPA: endonuclease/exonuclease/phosphatase family protein [Nocardioidaceae bacterium]|nr:endonuclease/exonuclease/phosphatase family protein [Nocardioidaceae bacterium]